MLKTMAAGAPEMLTQLALHWVTLQVSILSEQVLALVPWENTE
jgi:hypothetical protein